ncbi:glycosyltransferase family 4 protein [Terriglobus saanensis]|uniref:Glycosyl transferase group 1 n=1 Tax=Terriglobus saanensis (strain ATCC BAA-1853 / DSM 23119 / SP1PR4) TaxID=401053 RepID=E8V6Z0_TERSS|nr:glycosyltransferase family 1 protein [Terriglobus saanensis]ADV85014.1 glycosyl transferase group 1 [Terriglobus saanensis SP1PR4]
MKILIDATGVQKEKAGVGVYAKNLLDHLTCNAGDLEFFILAQDDDRELDFGGRPQITMLWVPARFFRVLALRFLLEQIYLPFLLLKLKIQVVHSLHYAFPLITFGTRRVVTFHDMTFFTMPEVHERIKIIYFRTFMRASIRMVDQMIFVSRSALEDCTVLLGLPHGHASVIPHGKGEEFRSDYPASRLRAVREKYGLKERFVLYIGTIEPRKNLSRLVEAFAGIARLDSEIQLVIAGKMGWKAEGLFARIEQLELASGIVFTGFIAEEDKAPLLAACTVFVYPSLYEGFGLPALEALACGAPTITSNTSSLPEVVGKAALLVDPTSIEDLQAALERVLSSADLQGELRQAGPERASHFTWEKTASLTAQVYRSRKSQ